MGWLGWAPAPLPARAEGLRLPQAGTQLLVLLAFDLDNVPSLPLTALPPWLLLGVLSQAPLIFQTPKCRMGLNAIPLSPRPSHPQLQAQS